MITIDYLNFVKPKIEMSNNPNYLTIKEQMTLKGKGRPPSKKALRQQLKSTNGKSSDSRQGVNSGRSRLQAELDMRPPLYEVVGKILPSAKYANKEKWVRYYHNRYTPARHRSELLKTYRRSNFM